MAELEVKHTIKVALILDRKEALFIKKAVRKPSCTEDELESVT